MSDLDRPLNKRGERDAPRMGKRLARSDDVPELIVSSAAVRAARTAMVIAEQLGLDPAEVVLGAELYLAAPEQLLDVVRSLDEGVGHAALVAHNPGITDFVNALAGSEIDNVPTCGVARLKLDVERWDDTDCGCAELLDFDYPKREAD